MAHASDHADADEIDNDPLPKWGAEVERDVKGAFRAKLHLPDDDVSVVLRSEDIADARRLRAAIFSRTGKYLCESDASQLFRLLPSLMEAAHELYVARCDEAGVDPYAEAVPSRIKFIKASELSERSASIQYAVNEVLAVGQPCIIGGSKKTLKTTLSLDLAVSLATGSKFLGEFDVLQKGRVGFISAESGEATIRETASRICRQKGYMLSSVDILFVFEIIKLSVAGDIAGLKEFITQQGIRYLFLDPLYLCLFAGDTAGRQASNLFDVGSLLWPLTQIGQETGCTIILLHHTGKTAGRDGASVGLGDLAFAGFGEWARQWILLSRTSEYTPGSGVHELSLEVGGSAGHSGRWAITVDEGRNEEGERSYVVDVTSISQRIRQEEEAKRLRSTERERALRAEQAGKVAEVLQKHFPSGATKSDLQARCGLSGTKLNPVLAYMLGEGMVEPVEITKGKKTYDGFRLHPDTQTRPRHNPDNLTTSQTRRPRPDTPPIGGLSGCLGQSESKGLSELEPRLNGSAEQALPF